MAKEQFDRDLSALVVLAITHGLETAEIVEALIVTAINLGSNPQAVN